MIPMAQQHEAYIRAGVTLLLLVLLAAGFWLRVRHLGDLGLVWDEGRQILAVRGILEHGVPRVDSGIVYTRSILFLYAQAATAKLFGLNEFSLRLPSVLFGVAGIFAAYVLAKSIFNHWVGLLTAAMITFSVWEIEFSRFGRFYIAFQCMYLVSLLCFYRGFILGDLRNKFWFVVAALIAMTLYEPAVLLMTCFLIPLPSNLYSLRSKLAFGLGAAGVAGFWVLQNKLHALFAVAMSVPHHYAAKVDQARGTFEEIIRKLTFVPMDVPNLSFVIRMAGEDSLALLGLALVPGAATGYFIYRFSQKDDGWRSLFAVPMVWMAFIHQFGLVLLLLAAYLVFFARNYRSLLDPRLKVVYAVALVCLAFWIRVLTAAPEMTAKRVIQAMLKYPDLYSYFLKWFVLGWPILTIVVGLGSFLLLNRFIRDRNDPAPLFMLGALFAPAVLASFSRWVYSDSIYAFHLYPLLLMIFAWTAIEASRRLIRAFHLERNLSRGTAAAATLLVALLISQDANPMDAWSIGSRAYWSAKDPKRAIVTWEFYAGFQQDHKSPSLYVREQLVPGDRVLVVGLPHTVAIYRFYVGRADYAVGRLRDSKYRLELNDGKLVDYMTGTEILLSLARVKEMIEDNSGGRIWILGDWATLKADNPTYPEAVKDYLGFLSRDPDYLGLDGQTFAVKLR